MLTSEILIAVFTGLTVVVSLLIYRNSSLSLRHDLSRSGTRGALNITALRSDWNPQSADVFNQIPKSWDRDRTRYFALRVHNRAPYETRVCFRMDSLRVKGMTLEVETPLITVNAVPNRPQSIPMFVLSESGWPSATNRLTRICVRVYTNLDDVVVRTRVWMKPVRLAEGGAMAVDAVPLPEE